MAFYRCGGGGIPSSLKTDMNAVLNKKFGTSADYPPADWPDTVNLMGPLPEATASGSIAHIEDGADEVPIKSWEVEISPTLTGKSAIEATQSGDSVFFPSDIVQGSISGSGYNSESTIRIRTEERKAVSPSTAYHIKCNSEILIYEVHEYQDLLGSGTYTTVNATETTITTKATTAYMRILFRYSNNATITPSALKYIQCTTGTLSPYTISTVNLGQTIYGGQADIVNGTGKDGYVKPVITSSMVNTAALENQNRIWRVLLTTEVYDGNFTYQVGVCNLLTFVTSYNAVVTTDMSIAFNIYTGKQILIHNSNLTTLAEVKAFIDTLDIVYPLATPTDFTFTPITPTPETALGVNNFWADEGDSEVTYRADINLALGGQ